MNAELLKFEYTNLAEVDPNFKVLPAEMYTLEIKEGKKVDFAYKTDSAPGAKNSHKAGDESSLYGIKYTVVDHPELSGRSVGGTYFPSEFTLKGFHRLAAATGFQQNPGESISEWLGRFQTVQPRLKFKTMVTVGKGRDGADENKVELKDCQPA